MPRMEAQRPDPTSHTPTTHDETTESPAPEGSQGPHDAVEEDTHTPQTDHETGAEWTDTEWADPSRDAGPDPDSPLADITDAIERLTQLDPADAAAPGTAIADILSRALEEEER